MVAVGDVVRVLPPFDQAVSGECVVEGVNGSVCTLDNGADFDSSFLQVVGQVQVVAKPKASMTRLEFLRRLTTGQRIAIRAAAGSDPILADAMHLLDLAEEIRTDDADTVALIGYCVSLGLLSAADQAILLA